MKTLRVLSLYQPWASLMAIGAKRYETRCWESPYRGLVAIHAAKTTECDGFRILPTFKRALAKLGDMPHGQVLAVGVLVKVERTERVAPLLREHGALEELEFGDYADRRFAWMFSDVTALPKAITFRSHQGLFEAPWPLREQIAQQLPQLGLMKSEVLT